MQKKTFYLKNNTVKSNYAKKHWNLMAAGIWLYSLYLLLLVIDLPDQYKTIHCKSTNKNSVCNSLENLNKFIDKFPKTFYSIRISYNFEISFPLDVDCQL